MRKRSSNPQTDPQELARRVLDTVVTDPEPVTPAKQAKPEKNPAAVALGRLGGKKGGKARAAKLTTEQRKEIARKAAEARWKQQPPSPRTSEVL